MDNRIVDPRDRSVVVLALDPTKGDYRVSCRVSDGESARSVLLDGFAVPVSDVFGSL